MLGNTNIINQLITLLKNAISHFVRKNLWFLVQVYNSGNYFSIFALNILYNYIILSIITGH